MLLKFMQNQKVLQQFNPTLEEISRLKLSKLIKDGDDRQYKIAIDFVNQIAQSSQTVILLELLKGDVQAFAIV